MHLTESHINYIIRDIQYRGVVDDDLGEELVDHICTLVEQKMEEGERFIEAYENVRVSFGSTHNLQELQTQTINSSNYNTRLMFRNYLKIALRNLSKQRFYTFINVTGLAVSVTCCMLISLFVIDELSYDTFWQDEDRLYRTVRHGKYGDNEFHMATAPAPLGPALKAELPEIESVARFRTWGTYLVKTPNMTESIKESSLIFADPDVFELLNLKLLNGDAKTALTKSMNIAISETMATKYYGTPDAVGEQLILDGDEEYNVTAVFEDIPNNSHLNIDFIMAMEGMSQSKRTMWLSNNFFTYFKLKEGVNAKEFLGKLNNMADAHVSEQLVQLTGATFEEFKSNGNYMYFELQPISDAYLKSDFTFDIGTSGDITYVYLFTIIAVFILVIACINFMNLSTARSANRAKEVGVRKVLGSYKSHLVRQFLTESIILSIVAFFFSLVLMALLLPFFNSIADKSLSVPYDQPLFYLGLIMGSLLVGFAAGIYPAFFLSAFKPVNVLKGKLALGSKSGLIRSGLVVFQFFISIVLLVGTAAVYKQLNYIQNKKLGFEKEQVLMVGDAYMLGESLESFKEEVKNHASTKSVSLSGFVPVSGHNRSDNTFWKEGTEPTEDNMVNMQFWSVDEGYIETMGLTMLKGRNFNPDLASDSNALILNETAFKAYGLTWGENNIIENFDNDPQTGQADPNKTIKHKVIGVVKDFHFESMRLPIGNLALRLDRSTGLMSVRLNSKDLEASLSTIESIWKKFAPELPFNYQFLDSAFGEMYDNEKRLARVFTIFAGLAIFIGCLGLFALAAFMAEQRTKEIGIRKVMGASI
ncbi:ABC transporter permease, partial [Fulvivirga sp. RKSG066]|uniref:ABC transporter permease n=1 Tax=Fulvivirga aurantia TaxID=2529383 RepID=UPI0012BD105C